MNRVFTDPRPPQYKKDGVTLNSLGKLYFYEPGPTSTTKKAIYADKDLSVQLTNPVILDSLGRYPTIYMQESDYAVLHTDSSDVQIWRVDYYQPPTVEGQFDDWDAGLTYAVNDFVRYTNGKYYISLQSANKGKVPTSSPTYWSELFFLEVYNSSKAYSIGDIVYYDGGLWEARGASTGVTPGSDQTKWVAAGSPGSKVGYIQINYEYLLNVSTASVPASFDVVANVTKTTTETIGPTGSGADHIWADYQPTNIDDAKAVILAVNMSCSKSTGADAAFRVFCQFGINGGDVVYYGPIAGGYGGTTHGQDNAYARGVVTVPIDSNGIFQIIWSDLGSPDTESITLDILGYKS